MRAVVAVCCALVAGIARADAIDDYLAAVANGDAQAVHLAREAMERAVLAATRPGAEDETKAIAAKLTELLQPPHPEPVRREALDLLSIVGGEGHVETIAALLSNRELSDPARMALQRIPGEASTQALLTALGTTSGPVRLGVMEALAERGDEAAIPALRELTQERDSQVQWAALHALSKLGVPPTQVTELTASFSPRENLIFANAYIRAAFAKLDRGEPKVAARLFSSAVAYHYFPFQASAALTGMEMVGSEEFLRQALGYLDQPGIRATAIRLLKETDMEGTDGLLRRAYDVLPLSPKITVLEILAARESDVLDEVLAQARASDEPELRYVAAILTGQAPEQADIEAVAKSGSIWRRAGAADALVAIAKEHEAQGELDAARAMYEQIAVAPLGVGHRIAALGGIERIANPASLPVVVRLKDALFEAAHLRENFPQPRTQHVDVELQEIGAEESSRVVVRRDATAAGMPPVDPMAGGVVGNAAFELALDRAYAALLAAQDDSAGLRAIAEETESAELKAFVEGLLENSAEKSE